MLTRTVGRGFLLLATALLAAAASAVAATAAGKDRIVAGPSDVRLYQSGQLSPARATNPPPEADLRSLTLEKTNTGYLARLSFASTFHQLHQLNNKAVDHTIVVTVRPPTGELTRVALRPDGTGTLDHLVNARFSPYGSTTPTIEGNQVLLPIPASVGVGPDWEIDGAMGLVDAQGNGFHAHTAQVPVGALTGEVNPRQVRQAHDAALIQNSVVTPWQRGAPPAGTRPVSVHMERRGGKQVAVVTMDAPPQKIPTLQGKAVAAQHVQVRVAPTVDNLATPYVFDWDAQTGKGTVFATAGAIPSAVGSFTVTSSGSDLVFELPTVRGSAVLPGVVPVAATRVGPVAAGPPDTGPIPGVARAQKDPSSCPTQPATVTFPVGVAIKSGNLQILHQDNDAASGLIQPNGTAHLTSPGGRTYDLMSAQGTMLALNHVFQGCTYAVTITLQSPLPTLSFTPDQTPVPGTFALTLTSDSYIWVGALIVDATGNGFAMDGAAVRVGVLLPATPPATSTSTSPPWLLIVVIAGGLVLVVLVVIVVLVVLRGREHDGEQGTYPEWTVYPDWTPGVAPPSVPPAQVYDRTAAVTDDAPPATRGAGPEDETTGTGTDTREPEPAPAMTPPSEDGGEEETTTTDCDELRRLCAQARAAAAEAQARAAAAAAAAARVRKDCDDASRAVGAAEAALRAAEAARPDERSWVEDAETGRRVTTEDVRLQNAAAQAAWEQYRAGTISAQELVDTWNRQGSAEGLEALRRAAREARQRRIDQARADLAAARARRDATCGAIAQAQAAAEAAAADAAAASARADEICRKADECEGKAAAPPTPPPPAGGGTPGGTGPGPGPTDGGSVPGPAGGGGAGGTPPPPKKEPKCPPGAEREEVQTSPVYEIPAEGAEVEVIVTDLKGGTSTPHRYPLGLFYEVTPPEFRGHAPGGGTVGSINLYTIDITLPMESVQYTCTEKWKCEDDDWHFKGSTKKQIRCVPYVKVLLHKENLDWGGLQAALRTSWPGLGRIMEAGRAAESFCPGAS